MFANFTEETCTGTGDTLTLTGATATNIPMSASFADGDLVSYALEDSAGIIKIAGIGTYVLATDDITRDDNWNWNGTVVDKNPATNITLSGGVHTVRCESFAGNQQPIRRFHAPQKLNDGIVGSNINGNATTNYFSGANILSLVGHTFERGVSVFNLSIQVFTAGAAGEECKFAIFKVGDSPDKVGDSVYESALTLIDSVGIKTVTTNVYLPSGSYWVGIVAEGTTVVFKCYDGCKAGGTGDWGVSSNQLVQSNLIKPAVGVGWKTGAISPPATAQNLFGTWGAPFILLNKKL